MLVLVLLAALLHGCGTKETNRTLAVVNGRQITESFVRDVVQIKARIREIKGKKVPDKEFATWANKEAERLFPELVSAETLSQGIEDAGIAPDTNDTALVLAKYNLSLRKKAKSPEDLYGYFGNLSEAFRLQFHRSCLFEAFKSHTANQEVSEAEIQEYYADLTYLTNVTAKIDRKGKANAEKAWNRLKVGEDWDVVARECSEDKLVDPANESFSKDWATVDKEGLGYPELAIALRTLHKGDFSKPLDVDEGLIIVKVMEEGGGRYILGRMLFRMAEKVEIPPRDEAIKEIRLSKVEKARADFSSDLKGKAVISYPCGTNFNFKVFGE